MLKDKKIEFQQRDNQFIIDSMMEYIWTLDTSYNLTGFNEIFQKFILKAYDFNIKKGVNIEQIDPEAFNTFWKSNFDRAFLGERIVFEYFPAEETCFEVKLSPIILDNAIVGLTGYGNDISERKMVENQMVESENRFKLFTDIGTEGIAILQDDKIKDVNKAFLKMLNYSLDELMEMSFEDIIYPEDLKIARNNIETGATEPYELRLLKKGGAFFYSNVKDNSITYNGTKARLISFYDKASIKGAQKKIDFQTDLLAQMNNAAIVRDPDNKITYWNHHAEKLYQWTKDEVIGKNFNTLLKPKYLDAIKEEKIKTHKGTTYGDGEYSFKKKDGALIDVLVSYSLIKDKLGEINNILCISTDISKRKIAELALVETHKIVSNSPLVIFHWRNDRYWNTSFVTENVDALLGHQANEFLSGKISYRDVIHPEDSQRLEEEILAYSKSNMDETLIQEYRVINKDGSIKHVRDFPSVIRDKNNRITHFNGVIQDITEEKNTKDALIQSERLLKQSQRVANIGTYTYNLKSLTWESSEIHDSIYGIDASFNKNHEGWLNLIHPEDKEDVAKYFKDKKLLKQGNFEKEYRIIRFDTQEVRWIRDKAEIIKDKGLKPIKVIGTIQDITEQKKIIVALKENEEKFSKSFYDNPTPMEIIDIETGEGIEVNESFLKMVDYDYDSWRSLNFNKSNLAFDQERFKELMAKVKRSGALNDEPLTVVKKSGNVLDTLVSVVKLKYGRGDKLVCSFVDITEINKAKEALLKNEAFLVKSQRVAKTGSYITHKDRTWDVSKVLMELLGIDNTYNRNESGFYKLIHPDDVEKATGEFYSTVKLKKKQELFEYRMINQLTKEVIWVRDIGEVEYDEQGDLLSIIGTIQDITKEKEAELVLVESEKKYSRLLVNIPNVSWKTDSEVNTSYISDNVTQVFGFTPQEIYESGGEIWNERIHPEDLTYVSAAYQNFFKGKTESYNVEHRIKHKKGHWIWLHDQANVLEEIDGVVYAYGAFLDITKKKEAEIALEESERKLKAVLKDQTEMIVRWQPGGIRTYVNEAYCQTFNLEQKEVIGTSFFPLVNKSDLERFKSLIDSVTPDNPISKPTAYTVNWPDGTVGWHEWTFSGFFDKEGKILYYQSTGRDITERKRAEEKLIKSELNYRSIFNNVNDAICIHNTETGEFLDANSRFEELLGYSKEELKIRIVGDLSSDQSGNSNEKALELIKKAATGEPQTFEWEAKHKNGSIVPVEVSLRKIILEGIPRVSASARDITERKKAELVLQEAFAEVSKLKKQLESENIYLKEQISLAFNFEEIVYSSTLIRDVLTQVEQVANTKATVLILGETGTGKELIARAVHNTSSRNDNSFIRVNCAAIPSELIESELFGHIKGSFTGAINNRIGKFELADGGTLFLDEIGEMPLELQPKLLRAIQEGEIEPIGGSQIRKLDVRIIAATNRDLKKETKEKRFREDLYFRLNVFPITVPPLRHRIEDIPVLLDYFVNKFCSKYEKKITHISDMTLQQMKAYAWPGNVRELENLVERAVIISDGDHLVFKEFDNSPEISLIEHIDNSLEEVQRNHIIKILNDTQWKIEGKVGAAKLLNIKPSTLRDRMKKFGIKKN